MFIDRQRELKTLDKFHHGPGPGLLILYGRRRVGKTRLLSHWIDRGVEQAFYWMATTHSLAYQLQDFAQKLQSFDPRIPDMAQLRFRTWEEAFEYIADLAKASDTPLTVVLDEFTYLIRQEPALVSVLQRLWDHKFPESPNLRLILSGSMVGMIEREVLAYQAPLYGRATHILKLEPLEFGVLSEMFPQHSPAQRVAIYAICGGVPAYLRLFTRARRIDEALLEHVLEPGNMMLADPHLILHDQLQDPHTYQTVLSVIAHGFHTWSDIAKMAQLSENSIGAYLQTLQVLGLVEKREPVLASPRSRRGRYHVSDPYLRFYYRFIEPHLSDIQRGKLKAAVRVIVDDLRAFTGTYTFEELCREWVRAEAYRGGLGFTPEEVGAYWGGTRGQGVQLDVVAASRRDKRLFIGEVKWGQGDVSRNVLRDLIKRSKRMPQVKGGWQVQYGLFAREGFTDAAKDEAQRLGARLVTLEELERTLREYASV